MPKCEDETAVGLGCAADGVVLKPGKVAIVTRGRFAGRKVVILKPYDEGTKQHFFPHALVAGIERYPLKVTKSMSGKKIAKRSKVKIINYNHIMPTRYALEGAESLRQGVGQVLEGGLKEPSQREEAKKLIKKHLEERYQEGKNRWFYQPLRF